MRRVIDRIQSLPLRRRLSLFLFLPCLAVLLIALTIMLGFQLVSFRGNLEREIRAAAQIVAYNCAAAVNFNDETFAVERLQSFRTIEHVEAAALILPDGRLFASYGESNAVEELAAVRLPVRDAATVFEGKYLTASVPVVDIDKRVATLQVRSNLGLVYHRTANLGLALALLAAVISTLVAAGVSRVLKRFVSDPVLTLSKTARQVAEARDYSVRARESNDSEFGVLTRAFNQMLGRIQTQDAELQNYSQRLAAQVTELQREIGERKKAEQELEETHRQLLAASRQAGRMAEVASGVLHNVGNVLNSVNVSVTLLSDKVRAPHTERLGKLAAMLEQNRERLGEFLDKDRKGRLVPDYLRRLASHMDEERAATAREIELLGRNVEHIKEIVAIQQSYARVAGVTEDLAMQSLVEDALCIQLDPFLCQGMIIRKEYTPVPLVRVDKHKVLQILVNLFCNARHSMIEARCKEKELTVRISNPGAAFVRLEVIDNGIGIAPENLTRIFQHGFTTKRDGHGFGLHSGALAAKEMGGTLRAASEGADKGATFVLELPAAQSRTVQ